MIKSFGQFESAQSEEFTDVMGDIKNHFNGDYINMYILDNFNNYCDEEDMEETNYDDPIKYYKEEGAGGNGIEYDLIDKMWKYLKEKHNIDLSEDKYEDLRYSIDYYIKDNFPYFYFVDYRKESDYDKLIKNFNNL